MTELERLSEVIKKVKESGKAKSLTEFSSLIGYSASALSKLLTKKLPVSDKLKHKIAEVYNVNVKYLYRGELPVFINATEPLQKQKPKNAKNKTNKQPTTPTENGTETEQLKLKLAQCEELIERQKKEADNANQLIHYLQQHIKQLEEKLKRVKNKAH